MWQDVRYGARGLVKAPVFTVTVALTMAMAVGATTTVFSVVNGVLLQPLPYDRPEQLVRIYQQNSPTNRWALSVADYLAIDEHQQSLASVGALATGGTALTGGDRPERLTAGWMTSSLLETLGVVPTEGRGFQPADDEVGAPRVVIISQVFRTRYFGSDAGGGVVGETLTLDGHPHTVVGVLSPEFQSLAGAIADVWPILRFDPPTRRGPFFLRAVGRLGGDVTSTDAANDLSRISELIFPLWADGFSDRDARLTPVSLGEVIIGDVRRALLLLLGAAGFVLLIAIANVANLTMARSTGREREMALRTSLGATRGRLVRQLLAESVLLAAIGGLLGLAVAGLALDLLRDMPLGLPRMNEVGLDVAVLGFTALISMASAVVFGFAPVIHALSPNLMVALHGGGRGGSEGRRWHAVRSGLVTAEFALALPLLAGAVLLLTSLGRMQRVDPGFDPDGIYSARVSLPAARYPDGESVLRFWRQTLRDIVDLPGVEAAGVSGAIGVGTALPPDLQGATNNFDLADRPVPSGSPQPTVPWLAASPGFFGAMGIPLLRGRLPDETDVGGDSPAVVVVSKRWADRFYPGEDAIGRRLYAGGCTEETCGAVTVVGVVGDVRYEGLAGRDDGAVYEPLSQYTLSTMTIVLRGRAATGAGDMMAQVRGRVMAIDPELPLSNIEAMPERLWRSVGRPRFWAMLVGVFAAVGVVLATVGIYGVLSYLVTKRTRDIGVRMALGANAMSVWRMVVGQGMSQALVGIGLGVVGSVLMTRWLGSLLFDVSPTDPVTLVGTSLALLGIAFVACSRPARRATKVDPVRALAAE